MNSRSPSRTAPPAPAGTGIACVSIPRFAVEAERRRRKDIGSRLVLIGEATVYDYSLGAEASNVKRGMRMSEAIGLCHRAVVLPPDLPHYQRLFGQALDFLEELSPQVEPGETGLAYLSLRGLAVDARAFAETLISSLHRAFGFMSSAGVAAGKFPARVAAVTGRPGTSKAIEPGSEAAFLAPLSIEHLPLSDAVRWRLRLLGLNTLGDIASLPVEAFQSQFGQEVKRWWELARGIDAEPLRARVKEQTVVRRMQLPSAALTLDAIMASVERLVLAAYNSDERGGYWVRKAVVRGTLDGGGAWELPVAFREALADPKDAWFAMKTAIARRPPERPVEELEVELVGLSSESGKQAGMLEGKGKLWRQIEEAVRQMNAQQADAGGSRQAIGKVVAVEPWSRIPERRAALVDFDPST
jgi:nucleotidyltransferase/DNA polymerase involved in DNA repair